MKSGGHDADDFVQIAIEAQTLADGFGIAALCAVPETVAEDNGVDEAGDIVLHCENSAKLRLYAEHCEIVRAGGQDLDALETFHVGEICGNGPDDCDFLKDAGAIAVIPILRYGHADILGVGAAQVVEYTHQLRGIREGKRAKQDAVN